MNELDYSGVVLYPSLSEKSVALIDAQNKMVFIVDKRANKSDVKNAVEKLFNVKVDNVNILKDRKNRKKAFVKLNKKFKAEEIATNLGIV